MTRRDLTVHACSVCILAAVMVVVMVPVCHCQGTWCSVSTLQDDPAVAVLTCYFSYNMQELQNRLSVQSFNSSGDIEDMLECTWREGSGYQCTVYSSLANVSSTNVSRFLTVRVALSAVDRVSDDQFYICSTDGDSAVPTICILPKIKPPDPPVLYVNQTNTSTTQVSWETGSNGGSPLQGFKISYRKANDSWEEPVRLDASDTSYVATGLLCGTVYQFVIQTFNTAEDSLKSNVLEIKTNGSAPITPIHPRRMLREVNDTAVTLRLTGWRISQCPIQFFSIKYRLWGDRYWHLVSDNISSDTERQVTVRNLKPAVVYMMLVTAHSQAGSTDCEVQFTTADQNHPDKTSEEKEGEGGLSVGMTAMLVVIVLLVAAIAGCGVYCRVTRFRRKIPTPLNDEEITLNKDAETELTEGADHPSYLPNPDVSPL